jgi:hypothetical protein
VVVLALIAAACGGGGSTSGGSTSSGGSTASTEGETEESGGSVAKQANAICERAKKNETALFLGITKARESNPPKGQSEKEGLEELVLRAALPPVREAAKELSELEGSSAEEEKLDEIASGLEAAAKKAEAKPMSVAAESGEDPFKATNEAAAAAGYKTCSELA